MEEPIVKSITMDGDVTVLNPAVSTPHNITTPLNEEDVTKKINEELAGLFAQAKASLLRGRGLRIETGKTLHQILTLCNERGVRDYGKLVWRELGLKARTAYDYRAEYLKSLKVPVPIVANFATAAGDADGDDPKDDSVLPLSALTPSGGDNAYSGTQRRESKQSRKPAEGFNVRFVHLPKGMDKRVKEATKALGYARAAEILIAEAAKLTAVGTA
jgi:hypothetical protein